MSSENDQSAFQAARARVEREVAKASRVKQEAADRQAAAERHFHELVAGFLAEMRSQGSPPVHGFIDTSLDLAVVRLAIATGLPKRVRINVVADSDVAVWPVMNIDPPGNESVSYPAQTLFVDRKGNWYASRIGSLNDRRRTSMFAGDPVWLAELAARAVPRRSGQGGLDAKWTARVNDAAEKACAKLPDIWTICEPLRVEVHDTVTGPYAVWFGNPAAQERYRERWPQIVAVDSHRLEHGLVMAADSAGAIRRSQPSR